MSLCTAGNGNRWPSGVTSDSNSIRILELLRITAEAHSTAEVLLKGFAQAEGRALEQGSTAV